MKSGQNKSTRKKEIDKASLRLRRQTALVVTVIIFASAMVLYALDKPEPKPEFIVVEAEIEQDGTVLEITFQNNSKYNIWIELNLSGEMTVIEDWVQGSIGKRYSINLGLYWEDIDGIWVEIEDVDRGVRERLKWL